VVNKGNHVVALVRFSIAWISCSSQRTPTVSGILRNPRASELHLLAQFMHFTLRRPVINHFSLLQPKRTYIRSKFLPLLSTSEEKHEHNPELPPKPRGQNPPPAQKLPYFVPRDARRNLPVFCNLKNANTRKVTWLRGVEGDTEVGGRLPRFQPSIFSFTPLPTLYIASNTNERFQALRQDIVETLLPKSTTDPKVLRKLRVNSRVHQGRHIILAGGYWAPKVYAWLVERGF
jgi:hypothetical protein